jgi:RNA polymerase sigma factor (sigma-70 family)
MAPVLSTPLLRTQSDRRLASLASDGHDRAFEAIVERYRRPLQRYLRRLLSEPLAEDVLQATFVRAWQAMRAGTEVRDLRPWLYRIAHNQALNALRAAGSALPATTEELPAVSLETEVVRREELRETLDGIQALPDRQRAALVAVAVADRPHADVAAELGMSDGALRQLLLRARTTLRAAATALTPYPLVTWLAGGQEGTAGRVAEVAAGAGGVGVAFKASAAMLAAGAVVAGGPALRGEHVPAPARAGSDAKRAHRQSSPRHTLAVAAPAPSADHQAGDQARPPVDATAGGAGAASGHRAHHKRSGSGHDGSDDSGSSGSSSTGSSGKGSSGATTTDSDDVESGEGGSGSSGPGSSPSHGSSGTSSSSGREGSSGEGSSGREGSSGKGSGDDATQEAGETQVVATGEQPVLAQPETVSSGSGVSGTSGDGSGSSGGDGSSGSGSGDDGSGSGHEGSGG